MDTKLRITHHSHRKRTDERTNERTDGREPNNKRRFGFAFSVFCSVVSFLPSSYSLRIFFVVLSYFCLCVILLYLFVCFCSFLSFLARRHHWHHKLLAYSYSSLSFSSPFTTLPNETERNETQRNRQSIRLLEWWNRRRCSKQKKERKKETDTILAGHSTLLYSCHSTLNSRECLHRSTAVNKQWRARTKEGVTWSSSLPTVAVGRALRTKACPLGIKCFFFLFTRLALQ